LLDETFQIQRPGLNHRAVCVSDTRLLLGLSQTAALMPRPFRVRGAGLRLASLSLRVFALISR
jgi:hypothetical protein